MSELILKKEDPKNIKMPNRLIFSPTNFPKLGKRLLYLSLNILKKKQEYKVNFFLDDKKDPNSQQKIVQIDINDSEKDENQIQHSPILDLIDEETIYYTGEGIEVKIKWNVDRTVTIPYRELRKWGDFTQFKKAVKFLEKKSIDLYTSYPKEKEVLSIPLTHKCLIIENVGAKIEFSQEGIDLLTKLSNSYTKIPFETALHLSSKYSQRLYEILLLKCYGNNGGYWKVDIGEFKKLLGIEIDSESKNNKGYNNWAHLERATILKLEKDLLDFDKILSQTEDINKFKRLSFSYEKIKLGRKVVKLEFKIEIKSKEEENSEPKTLTEKQERALSTLKQLCVRENLHQIIIENHLEAFFKWNYNRTTKNIIYENPAGHLLKTLGLV